jgi:arylsulfatase A-like enzyme
VVVDDPVSILDLAATFYDYAAVSADGPIHSQSLRPLIEDPAKGRDFALNEWKLNPSRSGISLDLRTVRTKTHRLSVDLISGDAELYDFTVDPHELENRWDDPQYQSVRAELMDMSHARPDDCVPDQTPVGMA